MTELTSSRSKFPNLSETFFMGYILPILLIIMATLMFDAVQPSPQNTLLKTLVFGSIWTIFVGIYAYYQIKTINKKRKEFQQVPDSQIITLNDIIKIISKHNEDLPF